MAANVRAAVRLFEEAGEEIKWHLWLSLFQESWRPARAPCSGAGNDTGILVKMP
jgi:hypothetical protein